MSTIVAPRGTADLFPPASDAWLGFEARVRAIARRFGYGEIRTPMFESTELFVRGVGETTDIVEKEMYTFADKGGRSLTLRPEWTAPVVRALLEHSLLANGPQRLSYVGPFFRYERPQAGRYRQANQFGVECFGFAGPEADVEVIQIAHEVLRTYDLPGVALAINSIGDDCCRPAYREALLAHFRPHAAEMSADSQRRLERNPLRILDSKAPEDRPFVEHAPTFADARCAACAAHFTAVCGLLDAIGVAYAVDPKLVRGFDYYTRTVFEFSSTALGAQSGVAGGGRYDGLVASLGGPATPAVGFGMGIERFLLVLEKSGRLAAPERAGIAAIALGADARAALFPLVAALHAMEAGVTVTADYGDAKLATQLRRADRIRARGALVLGYDERAAGTVLARDLATREQATLGPAGSPAALARDVLAWYAGLPPAPAEAAA